MKGKRYAPIHAYIGPIHSYGEFEPPPDDLDLVPVTASSFDGSGLVDLGKAILGWALALIVIAGIALGITVGCQHYQNGIYGGMSTGDATKVATNAMIVQYGKAFTSRLRFANPTNVKAHLDNVLTGTGQVRVFHMIGPRGVRWCVDVWSPGNYWSVPAKKGGPSINVGGSYLIRKNCHFKVTG